MERTLTAPQYLSTINSTAMKFLNYALAALFFVFAWFQRNDIDPKIYSSPSFNNPTLDSLLWFLFYAIVGIAFIVINFKKLPLWYFALAALACVAEMSTTAPGVWENFFGDQPATMAQESMSAADPRVELIREFFGAVITLTAVIFQFWQTKKRKA